MTAPVSRNMKKLKTAFFFAILAATGVSVVESVEENPRELAQLAELLAKAEALANEKPLEAVQLLREVLDRRVKILGFEEPRIQVIVNRIATMRAWGRLKDESGVESDIERFVKVAEPCHNSEGYRCWPHMEAAARLSLVFSDEETQLKVFSGAPTACRCRRDLVALLEVPLFAAGLFREVADSDHAERRMSNWLESSGALPSGSRAGFVERQLPKVAATVARKIVALETESKHGEASALRESAIEKLGKEPTDRALAAVRGGMKQREH